MNTPRTLSLARLVQRPAPYMLQRRTAPWPSLYKEHLKYPSYPNLQHVLVKKKSITTRLQGSVRFPTSAYTDEDRYGWCVTLM